MSAWRGRIRWWVLGGALVLAAVGAVVWLGRSGPPRARVYLAFDACLLTDRRGVSGAAAGPVWAGMEAASARTLAKVSFLAVNGPDTTANAVPYVNTLVLRRCDLVLAVGGSEVAAVRAEAKRFTSARFVVVGSGPAMTNVLVVPAVPAARVSAAVERVVTQAVRHS